MKDISIGMRSTLAIVSCMLATGALACTAETAGSTQEEEAAGEKVAQPIVNGTSASAFTEAALVNGPDFYCSGAVIAPRVVLTAGHCVVGASSWTVKAPYASNQTAHGSRSWTTYTSTGDFVNPNTLDVAVIILDTPITMSTYPTLAAAAVASGTKAVNVGRIRNGSLSTTQLYVGAPVTLSPGSAQGFPLAYAAADIIESGDSGGPVYVGSGAARTLVAVNSGGGGGEILARVDLAYAKIQQLIAANGGSGGGTTTPPPTPPPAPPPTTGCTGTAEAEPNNTSNQPNALSGTRCGALASGSDVDWYSWSVPSAGVAYDVSLATSGDADLLMWKNQGNGWVQITNASPTHFAATSSAGGNYLIAVRSAGGSTQSYGLKLAK
ncbi:MAG TPA: trypsin-like serine protease [Labilithrix sp.]|nr:trypsin-like serine protease [Labilithrix sp.]